MKKHAYRARNINQISLDKIWARLGPGKVIVAIDVAKREFVVGLARPTGDMVEHLRFTHPIQTRQFMEVLDELRRRGANLEVALEPTGTYGDALVAQLLARNVATFSISPKRCHDAAEIFDGVPSQHDAKATMILARLHAQGLSKPWTMSEPSRRDLRAAVELHEIYADPMQRNQGRLEALLARHWPEFGEYLETNVQKTALALLAEYPGPEAVAADPKAAAAFMVTSSRNSLPAEKIAGVVGSAPSSLGVPMRDQERTLLKELAAQTLALRREVERIEKHIAALVQSSGETAALAKTVGAVTAAVLVAMLGPARSYESAAAYVKAMGLNLKEQSSGESKKAGSGLHITKRGPGLVRKYEYLATLRLIQSYPLIRQWYEGRAAYKAELKIEAVVAVMRKVARGLWHVGRGEPFDPEKLFDARRLEKLAIEKAVNR